MHGFEAALAGPLYDHPAFGFRRFVDEPRFVEHFLLNEAFKNIDAYRISTYLHDRARGG